MYTILEVFAECIKKKVKLVNETRNINANPEVQTNKR